MSNSNQPDVRRGVLAWPNVSPKNPYAIRAAAEEEANASVADDERVFDSRSRRGIPVEAMTV